MKNKKCGENILFDITGNTYFEIALFKITGVNCMFIEYTQMTKKV